MKYFFAHLLYLLMLAGAFSACRNEELTFPPDGEVIVLPNGKLRVPFLLRPPSMNSVIVETRATTDKTHEEQRIHSVWVAVFESTATDIVSTDRLLQLQQGAVNTESADVYTHTFVDLDQYPSACRLRVVANISENMRNEIGNLVTLAQAIASGGTATTWGDIEGLEFDLNELYVNGNAPGGEDSNLNYPLPMTSPFMSLTEISATTTVGLIANLENSFARIDVNSTSVASNFVLKGALLLNGSKTRPLRADSHLEVNSGGVIEYSQTPAMASSLVSPIYLFPNKGALPGNVDGSNPTDIIIHGEYTTSGVKYEGYYKVRIRYDKEGRELYDINPNTLYSVNIKTVKGPGYASESDAKANEPHNMDYNVEVADAISQDVIIANGEYYLGVSNSEYILFADNAYGVTATTLSYNAPSTVGQMPELSLEGAGMALRASEGVTLVNSQKATLPVGNGVIQTYDIKVDMAESATTGKLIVRVGNLLKEIKLVKKPQVNELAAATVSATDIGGIDFEQLKSESNRITIGSDNSLNVAVPTRGSKVLATARGFDKDSRGTVLIALKRTASEVVYYERYADGTTGIYFEPVFGMGSTLKDDATVVVEAGYGIIDTKHAASVNITLGGYNSATSGEITSAGFSDYAGSLYPVNQENITITAAAPSTTQVQKDGTGTQQYVYSNFAKGVYGISAISNSESAPFIIRTPRQFRNIDNVNANPVSYAFIQEKNINFSDTRVGGQATVFNLPLINSYAFSGTYNGTQKEIQNLNIAATGYSIGLIRTLRGGTLKNMTFADCSIALAGTGSGIVGLIAGRVTLTAPLLLDNIHLRNVDLDGKGSSGDYGNDQDIGGLIGHYFASGSTLTITNCETDENCSVRGWGSSAGYSGVGGFLGSAEANGGSILTIKNCINRGTVFSTHGIAGGMVGELYNSTTVIENCTNEGAISAGNLTIANTNSAIGGIAGHSLGNYTLSLNSCVNRGTLTSGYYSAGGIIGYSQLNATIDNCRNYGVIDASYTSSNTQETGGIVGEFIYVGNTIKNCTNYGEVRNGYYAGGIIGNTNAYSTPITNCRNEGAVNGFYGAGGIAGYMFGPVRTCMVIAPPAHSGSFIKGGTYAGGVIGYSYNAASVSDDLLVMDMRSSTAEGSFVASTNASSNTFAGGIIGYNPNNSTLSNACVVDARTVPVTPFASTASSYRAGGIMGSNIPATYVNQCVFLAKAPVIGTTSYPLCGQGSYTVTAASAYYLKGAGFNDTNVATTTGGAGYSTSVFESIGTTGGAWNTMWNSGPGLGGYPYLYLKSFSIPTTWPMVE